MYFEIRELVLEYLQLKSKLILRKLTGWIWSKNLSFQDQDFNFEKIVDILYGAQ